MKTDKNKNQNRKKKIQKLERELKEAQGHLRNISVYIKK